MKNSAFLVEVKTNKKNHGHIFIFQVDGLDLATGSLGLLQN